MGDVVSLVERAAETIQVEDAEKLAAKMAKGKFDLDDLWAQLRQMQRMGGLGALAGMMPGLKGMKGAMDKAQHLADRKSTRLNSSHMSISYAVFCLKKKKEKTNECKI